MSGRARIPLHGRNHCPGGSDPIPCFSPPGGGAADYETGVLALDDLRGYWRLGEGDFPYADTSGFDPADPADMIIVTAAGRVAMTRDLTPGALGVDDDGAVRFNFDGSTADSPGGDAMLSDTSTATHRFDFDTNKPFTVAVWIYPLASAHSYRGRIIGTLAIHAGADNGWQIHIDEPSRVVGFCRAPHVTTGVYPTVETPAGLAADAWHHIVGSYDGTTLRLYVNGTLVDTLADSSTMTATTNSVYIGVWVGPMAGSVAAGGYFYGGVDEAAVWGRALTDDEVAGLYVSGVSGDGAPPGLVLSTDGEGGVGYAYPTVKVDGARFDEILTGTNLDSTDNGDGTVTIDATGGGGSFDPATATSWWFPLVDSDGTCVLDGDGNLIPTLIPL